MFHRWPLWMIWQVFSTECGTKSINLNVVTEQMMKSKKLKLNEVKCHVMHIGRKKSCPTLKVNGSEMSQVSDEKYLGQYVSKNKLDK